MSSNKTPQGVQILGSAAAEGNPAMFCDCDVCRKSWQNGGKDIRMRTCYKLNDRVRVDFGPDNLAQEYKFQLHSERLEHLFFTHSHEDHMEEILISYRGAYFSHPVPGSVLKIYGSAQTVSSLEEMLRKFRYVKNMEDLQLELVPLEMFQPCEIGSEDMTVWALPADHMKDDPAKQPVIYVMRCGKKYLLIANDTGYFDDCVWDFLAAQDFKFDIVIADCCFGTRDCPHGHMGGQTSLDVKNRLTEMGKLSPDCQYIVNHFSHNCGGVHADFEAYFNPHGIEVGYDGMEIFFK